MNHNAEAEEYDDARSGSSWFQRFTARFTAQDDYEDEEEEVAEAETQPSPSAARASGGSFNPLRRGTTLRIDQVRRTHVTVRRAVHGFDDARRAVDGLKEGQQQIINLEQTPADMAERIVDFLNGATYAIDGSVEKIGEQVYLFTPHAVIIDIEEKPATSVRVYDRT